MAGYLDQYGAGDERREKVRKRLLLSLLILVVAGGTLYFFFKNYRQERQVRQLFELLANKDYKSAYRLWGCTEDKPCRDYPFDKFMEDWGPASARKDVAGAHIAKSRSCGSGVIMTVNFGNAQEEKLWVERKDLTIGFSPYPGCPPGL